MSWVKCCKCVMQYKLCMFYMNWKEESFQSVKQSLIASIHVCHETSFVHRIESLLSFCINSVRTQNMARRNCYQSFSLCQTQNQSLRREKSKRGSLLTTVAMQLYHTASPQDTRGNFWFESQAKKICQKIKMDGK